MRPTAERSKMMFAVLMICIIIISIVPSIYSLSSRGTSRTSQNVCGIPLCHPIYSWDNFDTFITIDSYYIPSKLLLGDSAQVYVNISISSSTYPNNATYHRVNIYVSLTSTYFKVGIQGSPIQEFTKYPGYIGNYNFTIDGDFLGNDILKIDAKITSGHGGGTVNESVEAGIEVITIIPNAPPQLLDARVSPPSGDLETFFTYSVKYQDPNDDLPVNIDLFVDGGTAKPVSPLDGNPDTIPIGELYGLTLKGSDIGLGTHTFRFAAYDGKFDAVGDIFVHDGPEVIEKIIPNKIPTISIDTPTPGIVSGVVNITGIASDPDPTDAIGLVEVRLDNGAWKFANGGEDWDLLWDFNSVFPGNHIIYARATDGKDYSEVDFVEVRVVQVAPERPSVSITEVITINQAYRKFIGTSTPPDISTPVDLVETRLEGGTWTMADAAGPVGNFGLRTYDEWAWFLNIDGLAPGFYTVAARAWAGGIVSNPVSITITVERRNQAPIINSTQPSKNFAIHEGAAIDFVINIDEPEGENVIYNWFFEGAILSIPNTVNSYLFQTDYESAGRYIIEVLAFDGHSDNGTVYYRWNLTVLEGLVIEDQTNLDGKALDSEEYQEFAVAVLDPEGGRLNYEWYVNGESDPCGYGKDYKFFHEALGQNATYHTITLEVTNTRAVENSISWSLQVKGKSIKDGEPTEDIDKAQDEREERREEGNFVIGLMAVLVILASVFLIFVMVRQKRPSPVETQELARVQGPAAFPGAPTLYPSQPQTIPGLPVISAPAMAYPVQSPAPPIPQQPLPFIPPPQSPPQPPAYPEPIPPSQPSIPLQQIAPPAQTNLPMAQPVQPYPSQTPPPISEPVTSQPYPTQPPQTQYRPPRPGTDGGTY